MPSPITFSRILALVFLCFFYVRFGLLGIVLGAGGATLAAIMQKLPPAYLWGTIGLALVMSFVVGLVFGLLPAWRASQVDPVEALRS